jgi:retron-type reverse transcriptase
MVPGVPLFYIMQEFQDYFSDKNIIKLLIKERIKRAQYRSEFHTLANISEKYTKNIKKQNAVDEELTPLFPPRRKWLKLNQKERCRSNRKCNKDQCSFSCKERQAINSFDRNILSLNKTIRHYKNKKKDDPTIIALKYYCEEIRELVFNQDFRFTEPKIIPIEKSPGEGVYRPIAQYLLKDKIIISLTNKYFTAIFDPFFYSKSYAFRLSTPDNQMNHHRAFEEILKFNKTHKEKDIWVSECDIKKFYDTVNHKIIKKQFTKLKKRVANNENLSTYYSIEAERIFYSFLHSYTFNHSVEPLNRDDDYWISKFIDISKKHKFGWIEKTVLRKYYITPKFSKIGIPQGGALSGLIANIVLDSADKTVIKKNQDNSSDLYVRFCDDIIILNRNKKKNRSVYNSYYKVLKKLKLFPHKPEGSNIYNKNFWGKKTKLNYLWSYYRDQIGIPWVGFVGYEIKRDCSVRVRKKSIKKEMIKQKEWIEKIKTAVSNGRDDLIYFQVKETAIQKLIGMSVGRPKVHNYIKIEHDMCWINGFQLLNNNKFSRFQLKQLDHSRNKNIADLLRFLRIHVKKSQNDDSQDDTTFQGKRNRQEVEHYGKPFSYYYNALRDKDKIMKSNEIFNSKREDN